jgi:hypothetical protein
MWVTKRLETCEDLRAQLSCARQPAANDEMAKVDSEDGTHWGTSSVHDVARLPREFRGLHSGHAGSHQFLVDDFVKACVRDQQPPNNVWQAARYLLPGLVGHESSMKGGELLEVPDFGDCPTPVLHLRGRRHRRSD